VDYPQLKRSSGLPLGYVRIAAVLIDRTLGIMSHGQSSVVSSEIRI